MKDGRQLRLLVLQPSVDWSTATTEEIYAERFTLIAFSLAFRLKSLTLKRLFAGCCSMPRTFTWTRLE